MQTYNGVFQILQLFSSQLEDIPDKWFRHFKITMYIKCFGSDTIQSYKCLQMMQCRSHKTKLLSYFQTRVKIIYES